MLTTENNPKIELLTLKIKTSKCAYTPPKYFNQDKTKDLCYPIQCHLSGMYKFSNCTTTQN